jgi:hypothetical protein
VLAVLVLYHRISVLKLRKLLLLLLLLRQLQISRWPAGRTEGGSREDISRTHCA